MSTLIEVESDNEGQIAVPAKLLLDTLKTFPEQPQHLLLNQIILLKLVQTTVNMH